MLCQFFSVVLNMALSIDIFGGMVLKLEIPVSWQHYCISLQSGFFERLVLNACSTTLYKLYIYHRPLGKASLYRECWCSFQTNDLLHTHTHTPTLTNGDFFDELSSSVCPLHEGSRPRRQIPVGLHSEDVGLDAPPCARPSGKHQLRTLGGRTPGAARMNQSGGRDAWKQRHM